MEWGDPENGEIVVRNEEAMITEKDFVKLLFLVITFAGAILLIIGIPVMIVLSLKNGLLMILIGIILLAAGFYVLKKLKF